jgi:hypothetical protein
VASDARVLGSGEFIAGLVAEAAWRDKETLRLPCNVVDLAALGRKLTAGEGIGEAELRSGIRTRGLVRARQVFCQLAIKGVG